MIDQETLKERIDNIGIRYSKAREYLGIGRSHFSRCLNGKAFLSEHLEKKLDYFITQYENITL
mgnify:CR=1 FL=1|tara:strand:+ start:1534 stop:1722 length:189 start_codon:yes stop_codon:yes gene_type:complete